MNKEVAIKIGASIVSIAAVIGLKKGITMMIENRKDKDELAEESTPIMEEQ